MQKLQDPGLTVPGIPAKNFDSECRVRGTYRPTASIKDFVSMNPMLESGNRCDQRGGHAKTLLALKYPEDANVRTQYTYVGMRS